MDHEADTVAAPSAPDDDATPPAAPTGRPRRTRRLGARTIAICACLALVAAIAAALVASVVLDDEDDGRAGGPDAIELTTEVDADDLLATEVLTVAGEPTTLAALRTDQPMVVNLWAQSCVPCIDEMPLLEAAHQANPDLTFVGVDTQDQVDKAKVMAERTGITYQWVQDPTGDFFYAAKGAGMPTTFILTTDGEVVASKTGAFSSAEELQGWLDAHAA
ncbi:MAG TPA: TlpA disulfide reductase family protein [Aquihabitans sp.]|nr:TlpA disulfide reductase family protein [Aquihabitans sp.]